MKSVCNTNSWQHDQTGENFLGFVMWKINEKAGWSGRNLRFPRSLFFAHSLLTWVKTGQEKEEKKSFAVSISTCLRETTNSCLVSVCLVSPITKTITCQLLTEQLQVQVFPAASHSLEVQPWFIQKRMPVESLCPLSGSSFLSSLQLGSYSHVRHGNKWVWVGGCVQFGRTTGRQNFFMFPVLTMPKVTMKSSLSHFRYKKTETDRHGIAKLWSKIDKPQAHSENILIYLRTRHSI